MFKMIEDTAVACDGILACGLPPGVPRGGSQGLLPSRAGVKSRCLPKSNPAVAAVDHAIRDRLGRRSLTGAEIKRCVPAVHRAKKVRRKARDGNEGNPAHITAPDPTAEAIGVSPRLVGQILIIERDAKDQTEADLDADRISINRAYEQNRQRK
jgi:hypothetical protein